MSLLLQIPFYIMERKILDRSCFVAIRLRVAQFIYVYIHTYTFIHIHILCFGLSFFVFRFSFFASRLSPLACRLSPLASRLSPLASRLSPLASRLSRLSPLSPLASRLSFIPSVSHNVLHSATNTSGSNSADSSQSVLTNQYQQSIFMFIVLYDVSILSRISHWLYQ